VTNIPVYGTASVAQFTYALLLELCHHVALHSDAVRSGEWSRSSNFSFWKTPLVELAGRTLGILGFGKIGRRVGKIAIRLRDECDRGRRGKGRNSDWPGFRWCDTDELLSHSDVISLHWSAAPEHPGTDQRLIYQ
jgi:glycerate dehydrogenase